VKAQKVSMYDLKYTMIKWLCNKLYSMLLKNAKC